MEPMQAGQKVTRPDGTPARTERKPERHPILASTSAPPRHMLDSVRRRLVLVLAFALTPIAALCFAQSIMQLWMQEREARQQLVHGASLAAAGVEQVFALTELALRTLSDIEDVRSGGTECATILRGTAAGLPFASSITLFDAAGQPVCSSGYAPAPLVQQRESRLDDVAGARVREPDGTLHITLEADEKNAANNHIRVMLPLDRAGPSGMQMLVMNISVTWVNHLLQRTPQDMGRSMTALLTAEGRELASSTPGESVSLFTGQPDEISADILPVLEEEAGQQWTYATAPVGRDGLRVAFAMPVESLFRWSALTLAAGFALPALIVAFSLLALWLAVDSVVLRWLQYLRRVTAVYAQGHYRFRPSRLKTAPGEFRVLGEAIEDMASAVRVRDAHLRTSLAEKTALVREIHHRIKNSLQIVVSLLSLYGARLDKGDDRRRFEQLRLRINTLALVHRILYEVAEGSQVHLDELLRELAGLLERAGDQPVRIHVNAKDAPISTDMAVPLALMVAEIVLSLGAEQQENPTNITLTGSAHEGQLLLQLQAGLADGEDPVQPSDLAHGFASQLGGALSSQTVKSGQIVSGTFPCPVAGG